MSDHVCSGRYCLTCFEDAQPDHAKAPAPTVAAPTNVVNVPDFDIAAGDRALYPFGEEALALPRFDRTRVLVRLVDPSATYEDEWTPTTDLRSGRAVKVRRADCGLGCRCAGEVAVES